MQPTKYSFKAANKVDLGAKLIYAYPTPTKLMSVAKMIINGRHPEKPNEWFLEHDCQFVIYVTKGKGKVYADKKTIAVTVGDVVFIPTETPFAVEGNFEYITFDAPGFYPEQSEIIKS